MARSFVGAAATSGPVSVADMLLVIKFLTASHALWNAAVSGGIVFWAAALGNEAVPCAAGDALVFLAAFVTAFAQSNLDALAASNVAVCAGARHKLVACFAAAVAVEPEVGEVIDGCAGVIGAAAVAEHEPQANEFIDGSAGVIDAFSPLSACSVDATGLGDGNDASVACFGNDGVCAFFGEAADGWAAAWIAGRWYGGDVGRGCSRGTDRGADWGD